jgi:hypothetical protein
MTSKFTFGRFRKLSGLIALLAVAASIGFGSCNKQNAADTSKSAAVSKRTATGDATTVGVENSGKGGTTQVLTSVVTVAAIRPIEGSTAIEAIFNENTEFFTVTDPVLVDIVKTALNTGKPLQIGFNPWEGTLVSAKDPSAQDITNVKSRQIVSGTGHVIDIDFTKMKDDAINEPSAMGILNTTDPGLNNVIPDFATAQLMFDYITRQCCALPGPYGIDHCITFQYCQDGCYARAHKMCWILNNKYKYGTKKIFSFANSGSDKLCVQGQKWGGCCIRWWYHVAPLVTVQTTTGPKAYVFDPAMFNQPVLLATWLHAQENPTCAIGASPPVVAHVSMINVQPTSSYTPAGYSGLSFGTDPTYSSTNSVMTTYSSLITCP